MGNYDFKGSHGRIEIHISDRRIMKNIAEAQCYLDGAVLDDCNMYVPFRMGELRNSGTRNTVKGSGEVKWVTPYAHYQHEGKVYVDPVTGAAAFYIEGVGFRSRKNVPKVESERHLQYHEAGTGSHWFEKAKRVHGKEWIKEVKKKAGGR